MVYKTANTVTLFFVVFTIIFKEFKFIPYELMKVGKLNFTSIDHRLP